MMKCGLKAQHAFSYDSTLPLNRYIAYGAPVSLVSNMRLLQGAGAICRSSVTL